ncbi:MAG: GNAT family N-acetyltransferase [Oligoflexus sp.]|nr:GNAT family N-acetyltransferase [Oligoflexus sp.]
MQDIQIRPIQQADNKIVAGIIKQVLTEFGLNREGFAFVDAELEALFEHYIAPKAAYYVAEVDGKILGGAGFGPLLGGDEHTAELKKMYVLTEGRGLGLGSALMRQLLPMVAAAGYRQIYLETMPEMKDAIRLYEKFDFCAINHSMGNTGHHGCQSFFLRSMP